MTRGLVSGGTPCPGRQEGRDAAVHLCPPGPTGAGSLPAREAPDGERLWKLRRAEPAALPCSSLPSPGRFENCRAADRRQL